MEVIRAGVATAALLIAAWSGAVAQTAEAFEIGGFGRHGNFDDAPALNDDNVGGGSFGIREPKLGMLS